MWTERQDEKEQHNEIAKQIAEYDKRSWLVHVWWRITGVHKDITDKRLWLSYQDCKHLQQKKKEDACLINIDDPDYAVLENLIAKPFLPSSWRGILTSIYEGLKYFTEWKKEIKKQNPAPVQYGALEQAPQLNLKQPLLAEKAPPVISTAVISRAFQTRSEEQDYYENLCNFIRACGFFNLNLMDATPRQIKSVFRKNVLLVHPDKVELEYKGNDGQKVVYSEDTLAFYRRHRSHLFDFINSKFGKLDLPQDEKLFPNRLIEMSKVRELLAEGRRSRASYKDHIEIGEMIAEIRIALDERMEKIITESAQHIAFMEQSTAQMEQLRTEMEQNRAKMEQDSAQREATIAQYQAEIVQDRVEMEQRLIQKMEQMIEQAREALIKTQEKQETAEQAEVLTMQEPSTISAVSSPFSSRTGSP
ncbi:MAG: hypothetical protein P4M14_10605 [Gammaproteobacteria bacterium]|nr:hypothetical protein [Gammaproteobacteria bacterium]